MTERLTPGMLRDLAALWSRKAVPNGGNWADMLREEAARREAEAKPKQCPRLNPPVCLHPKACESTCTFGDGAMAYASEGPGSADAEHMTPEAIINYMRSSASCFEERCAANCIEAQAREIAELTAGQHVLTVMEAERDALKARVARLVEAGRALLAEETVTVQTGYDNGPGGGNYVYSEAVRTDSEAFKKFAAALAEANDAK